MAKKGTTRYRSNKQEREVAKIFGGKQVIASGSLWFADSDVRSDKCLIECKTTENNFYPVTTKVWEKINEEAVQDHMRTPILVVDLIDRDRYVIFNPKHFNKKLDTLKVVETNKVTSTFRVYSWGTLAMENPMQFSIKSTVQGKTHDLVVWTEKNFLEYFKEEL